MSTVEAKAYAWESEEQQLSAKDLGLSRVGSEDCSMFSEQLFMFSVQVRCSDLIMNVNRRVQIFGFVHVRVQKCRKKRGRVWEGRGAGCASRGTSEHKLQKIESERVETMFMFMSIFQHRPCKLNENS